MFRKAILAVALATGAGTAASAFPPEQPPIQIPIGVEGQWFMGGNPHQPCYIQAYGPRLILTNERGEQSRGRMLPGSRIIADDWQNGLVGDVRGNEIFWRNGDRWSR